MSSTAYKPLTDDQVRRFITDGYLVLNPDVPATVHAKIDERLVYALHKEGNPGNNVLSLIPELYAVIESPEIRGALTALLGPNYLLHPHRYAHNNEPGKLTEEGAQVGAGSHTFVGWHQDSHSPLARPRHHYCRYAMLLYYPQDTPIERGPTQLIPGTQWNRSIPDADKARGFQAAGPAGTCVLVHFDIVHGGSLNLSDRTRSMVKLVFARTEEPTASHWDCQETAWSTPEAQQSGADRSVVWNHQWEWLSGRVPGQFSRRDGDTTTEADIPALITQLTGAESLDTRIEAATRLATLGQIAAEAIPALIEAFTAEEPLRQVAIYTLASIGAPAVEPLIAVLSQSTDSHWNESAIEMEDAAYALVAIGTPAIPALLNLLDHESDWVRVNTIFALGEMGPRAAEAVPMLIHLLQSDSHAIVRTALDALGQIKIDATAALPEIHRLLTHSHPDWQAPQRRAWTVENQTRINAVMALLRLGEDGAEATPFLSEALDDDCGYVGGFGVEFLLRQQTPEATNAALRYLTRHRWDNTLRQGVRTY